MFPGDFGEVTVDWKRDVLSVTTDPITVDRIGLGVFAIEFQPAIRGPRPKTMYQTAMFE